MGKLVVNFDGTEDQDKVSHDLQELVSRTGGRVQTQAPAAGGPPMATQVDAPAMSDDELREIWEEIRARTKPDVSM